MRLILPIILLSVLFCSCEQMVEDFKTINKYKKAVNAFFPEKTLGIFYKSSTGGSTSIMLSDEFEDLSDEVEKQSIVIVVKHTGRDEFEQEELVEVTENIKETTKSIFQDRVKHGKIIFSRSIGTSGFRLSSNDELDFTID